MQRDTTKERLKELESLVVAEQDRLFRSAYMRVGDYAEAKDIVQDVFLKLFCSGENLANVRNLPHYLIRSVHNACNDWHRRQTVTFSPIEAAEGLPCSEEERDMHDEYVRINSILRELPAEQADILRLKCVDGLKFREIAMTLDIPEGTAKSRYRYAIENIQKHLKLTLTP